MIKIIEKVALIGLMIGYIITFINQINNWIIDCNNDWIHGHINDQLDINFNLLSFKILFKHNRYKFLTQAFNKPKIII